MDFKEYERQRDALTNHFIAKVNSLRIAGDVESWQKLRAEYSSALQSLFAEWQRCSDSVNEKVMPK